MVHLNPEEAKANKEKRLNLLRRQIKNSSRVTVTFRVLPATLKKFKKKLAGEGVTANDFLNTMILNYIEIEE